MMKQLLKNRAFRIKGLAVLIMVAAASFFCSQNASAIWMNGCDSFGGYCDCGATTCGATWLNGNSWGDGSNLLEVTAGDQQFVTGYLHGAVYTRQRTRDAGQWNSAHHVFLLNDEWQGDGQWNDWNALFAYLGSVDYISQRDGEIGRGVVSPNPGWWSEGWEWGPVMPVTIDLQKFIAGAWVDGDVYSRTVHVFRCYFNENRWNDDGNYWSAGCSSTPTTIRIRIPTTCGPLYSYDYRVYYEGKVSLRNGYGSPLYKNGSPFTNNESISWAGGNAEWSGWADSDNNSYVPVNLYTPKESGQKLNSYYQLKYTGNNGWNSNWDFWNPVGIPFHWELLSKWYGFYSWKSHYRIDSDIGGVYNRQDNYHLTDPWEAEREISQYSRTVDYIPYGTSRTYSENLNYKNDGNNHHNITQYICTRAGQLVGGWVDDHNYEEGDQTNRSRTIRTTINNPYNFNTSMSSAINGGSGATIIGGGTATLRYRADIMPKDNPNINNYAYYSKVPNGTKVSAVSFVLKPGVKYSAATRYSDSMKDRVTGVPNGNLCQYLAGIFGSDMYRQGEANGCQTLIDRNGSAINNNLGNAGNKITNGAGASAIAGEESKSVAIPDIEDGHKYCTVIGISHADSGNGFNVNNNWHISNISCRTIAKVPTFQAWGGVYTSGGINTATVKKIPSAGIDTPSGSQTYLFGSWAETLAIANQQVHGFATGAAIGYRDDKVGGLPVSSASNKINYCNITNISIANNRCSSGVSGNAGNVVVSNDDFLSKFLSRYSTTTTDRLEQITESVRYLKTRGNATFNDTPAIAENGYRLGNGVVSVKEGTIIFQVNGDVNINHNICTGYANNNGQCTNGSTSAAAYNSYALANENYQYRAGSKIPQVIIIASGNVNISKDVTEIDAWIYSGKTIKTCADGNIRDNTCNNPLLINGPVFAKNIELYRTYGSNGTRSWNGPLAANSNLLNSGATTPAEIFNLRADVYQWIYQQTSTENKSANVRYMRELSPRF